MSEEEVNNTDSTLIDAYMVALEETTSGGGGGSKQENDEIAKAFMG